MGWLGWTPDQVLGAPLPVIFLALEGKVDFLKKTNPFGGGEKKKQPTAAQKASLEKQRIDFAFMKAEAKQKHKERKANG